MSFKPPTTVDNNRYKIEDTVGQGCFGIVCRGIEVASNQKVAVKFEDPNCGQAGSLLSEQKLLARICHPEQPQGYAQVFFFGKEKGLTCMVMELLGKSLEDCLKECKGKMKPDSAVLVAEQSLVRIEYLHSKGIIHRDIKPENFMFGVGEKVHHLYLIDFGLSDTYFKRSHNMITTGNNMIGTARYASVNTHKGISQSRRDDLEAIAHMLIYFLRGALPWSGLKGANTEKQKYTMIGDLKASYDIAQLCDGMPSAFASLLIYSRSLPFKEKPDYERLYLSFRQVRKELGIANDHGLQWLGNHAGPFEPLAKWCTHLQPDDENGDLEPCSCCVLPSVFRGLRSSQTQPTMLGGTKPKFEQFSKESE